MNNNLSEKHFHNKLIEKGTRKNVDLFYKITVKSASFFRELVFKYSKNKDVLDYGCGVGENTIFLLKSSKSVIAIDISESSVKQASINVGIINDKLLKICVMDAEKLELPSDSFDLICSDSILHHLNLSKALSELSRVIKQDGRIILKEPLGHNPLINLFRLRTPKYRTENEHPLTVRDLRSMSNYFRNVDIYYFYLFSLAVIPFTKTRMFSTLLILFEKIDSFVFCAFPFMKKYAWISVIILSSPIKDR